MADLTQVCAVRAQTWLNQAVWPFWAAHGVDPRGGFYERLGFDGAPVAPEQPSRVRVQARQTYVFCEAVLAGWEADRAQALVARGVEVLLKRCRRPDGLFGRMVNTGAGLTDATAELYDNAFGLFALGWAAKALNAPDLVAQAEAIWARLDARLAHPAGGYAEAEPARWPRRQNPHMHLFEAALALYDASGEAHFADRAQTLRTLVERRCLDPMTGRLLEAFEEDWTPVRAGADLRIEPGHEFDWVWLNRMSERLTGRGSPRLEALYPLACEALDGQGFTPQAIDPTGGRLDDTRRTWQQTEALKAHWVAAAAGDKAARGRALALFDALFDTYFAAPIPGGWIDHFDANGRALSDTMTAATGYHAVAAMVETLRTAAMAGAAGAGADKGPHTSLDTVAATPTVSAGVGG
ncbi:MAG: AGE family epimerase/isomerase [Maricaulaceae bacterium]